MKQLSLYVGTRTTYIYVYSVATTVPEIADKLTACIYLFILCLHYAIKVSSYI